MPLSIFVDALPYSEVTDRYADWFDGMRIAKLIPNIAYSSVLHWQLYCDRYPDDRKKLVDWQKTPETDRAVMLVSSLLRPLDGIRPLSFLARKGFDRLIFRRNALANIPFRFRKLFSEQSEYLFWDAKTYGKEAIFSGYTVVSQDEGHRSFEDTLRELRGFLPERKDLFLCIGEIDRQGHLCARGSTYSARIRPYMDQLRAVIAEYLSCHPQEEVLIVSDHGMSTIRQYLDLGLEKRFGKQSADSYIAYRDSCLLCVWAPDPEKRDAIGAYLETVPEGHLLTEDERAYYRATDRKFGDWIFILKEGYCFRDSWFGCSVRKHPDGEGMHGFWPEESAADAMATVLLINGKRELKDKYSYSEAHGLISEVMKHEP